MVKVILVFELGSSSRFPMVPWSDNCKVEKVAVSKRCWLCFRYPNLHTHVLSPIMSTLYSYGNYTRILRAILNKSWTQHPTKNQLYGRLPSITKTIQDRRTRHAGHCWKSRDELISDVLLWTPTYSRAKAGRPARTCIQQLCEDMGCSPENIPDAMNDREKWRMRVRVLAARHDDDDDNIYMYIYIYIGKKQYSITLG